jgi:hypothetical protein
MDEILATLPCTAAVARYVFEHEALSLPGLGDASTQLPFAIVDFDSEAEEMAFVDFAAAFGDDGEAYTCAIAVHRHWAIATTDRKVIRLLQADFPATTLVSTPVLVHHWTQTSHPDKDKVRRAIRNIETQAHYHPRRTDPLFEWWQTYSA